MRRGGYKCRTLEIHLETNNIKQSHIYIDSYQNFKITANQKSTIDKPTNKKNQLQYNTKESIKPEEERTRKQGKKKEQQKQIQSN